MSLAGAGIRLGQYVQVTTTDYGNYKCTSDQGGDFKVDEGNAADLTCRKAGQY